MASSPHAVTAKAPNHKPFDANVTLVFDAVISLRQLADTNTRDHQRFSERLDNHDVRILALESSKPAKS